MVIVFCVPLQVNETESEDTDLQIFCVSCSHPINPKVAMRHMERCYAKVNIEVFNLLRCSSPQPSVSVALQLMSLRHRNLCYSNVKSMLDVLQLFFASHGQYESQTSFGSIFPTRIEG